MRFGALVIGDEILEGGRADKHMAKAIEALSARGLSLGWCRYARDDEQGLTRTLRETMASGDAVFSFGGIGATPDDVTRQCAAAAAGVPVERHPEALALIVERFGDAAYPHRALMADFPAGASIIPNPVTRIAGFSFREHHFLPGFPEMAWPMMEWVLDTRYRHLFGAVKSEDAILVLEAMESQLIPLMNQVVQAHPQVKLFSLPSHTPQGRRIELGVRGPAAPVARAMDDIRAGVTRLGFPWKER